MNSLRQKILFGYAVIATLATGFSLFSLIELRLLEKGIAAGEQISRLFDISLEIRRFEKNYFLYRQPADLAENRRYVDQAGELLREHAPLFDALGATARKAHLQQELGRYAGLMERYAATDGDEALAGKIRLSGKDVVTVAEDLAREERALLRGQIDRHRVLLLVSTVVVVMMVALIGHLLARRVARPLKEMEDRMKAVASSRLTKLEMATGDREIESLTQAFNHVLRELELRQGQLVQSEKLAALGTLLSGVAHELNNPLSNIASSAQILAEEVGAGDTAASAAGTATAFQRELVTQIDEETWRARRIVRSLLDYARDRDFRAEALDVAQLVEDTLRLIGSRIAAQVTVTTDVPAGLVVAGDRQRLQQLLINITGNAIDAVAAAGAVHIAARPAGPAADPAADRFVFGQCRADRAAVEIEIRDDGPGIAAEVLPRIFDPFFTTKDVGQGMGLGLFIAFEIVEEHGGCIAVNSIVGRGTTFTVRLPAAIDK